MPPAFLLPIASLSLPRTAAQPLCRLSLPLFHKRPRSGPTLPTPPTPDIPPVTPGNASGGGGGGGSSHNNNENNNNNDDNENNRGPDDPLPPPLAAYLSLLARHPLRTKAATSAFLTGLSDLLAQLFEQRLRPGPFNLRRLLALVLVGAVLTAPLFHYLYLFLEARVPAAGGARNVVVQLVIDQLLAVPAWLLAFFALVAAVEGRFDARQLRKQVDRDFVPAVKLTWTVFPPVQVLSFALLPPPLRVLALNVVDLVFTGLLSYLKHRPHPVPVARAVH